MRALDKVYRLSGLLAEKAFDHETQIFVYLSRDRTLGLIGGSSSAIPSRWTVIEAQYW